MFFFLSFSLFNIRVICEEKTIVVKYEGICDKRRRGGRAPSVDDVHALIARVSY